MAATPTPTSSQLTIPRVPGPTSVAWREQALARATELRGRLGELRAHAELHVDSDDVVAQVERHIAAAEEAASNRREDGRRIRPWTRIVASWRGAAVERSDSELDAAEATLLRIAPPAYVIGQLPAIVARTRTHLPATDPRLQRLLRLAESYAALGHDTASAVREDDREAIVGALRAATLEERRAIARIRSFRNILLSAAAALTVCAGAVLAVGMLEPRVMPLCFAPWRADRVPGDHADARPVHPGAERAGLLGADRCLGDHLRLRPAGLHADGRRPGQGPGQPGRDGGQCQGRRGHHPDRRAA
jgi:hypothetical protein